MRVCVACREWLKIAMVCLGKKNKSKRISIRAMFANMVAELTNNVKVMKKKKTRELDN